jgi:hypothetical protein
MYIFMLYSKNSSTLKKSLKEKIYGSNERGGSKFLPGPSGVEF